MEEVARDLIQAFKDGGPTGLLWLVVVVVLLSQQWIIWRQNRQIMQMAGSTGSAMSSTASAMTNLAAEVRRTADMLNYIDMRGARVEAKIVPPPLEIETK